MSWITWLTWSWERPFELEAVTDMLTHLASHVPQNVRMVFEVRSCGGEVRHCLGVERDYVRIITDAMKSHGSIRCAEAPPRKPVDLAEQLKITRPFHVLNTEIVDAVTRSGLAALQTKGSDEAVLQIVLGMPFGPSLTPSVIKDPHASWLKRAFGTVEEVSPESKKAIMEKLGAHGFHAVIRLGASGKHSRAYILSLLSALRPLRSAGVNIQTAPEDPVNLNTAVIPRSFPFKLSVAELSCFMLLPAGEADLPGIAGLHPRQILPPTWYRNPAPAESRVFALGLDRRTRLSISPKDSREHCIIIGSTGVGKSTVMQHLILSDIYAGRSVLVLDPKSDLVDNVLARIPKHREDDVVIVDPSSDTPVGLNPLAHNNHKSPELVADAIYAVFYELFKENFGIRTQDVLTAALYTLARAKNASLLMLPALLTDEAFRRRITAGINDKIGLEPFWEAYENMKESERRQEVAPVLNKVRQFILRPGLRNVLGQSNPKFSLSDLFTKPRIVLVPLNKGLIGAEPSKLLGSLIIGQAWPLALSRAALPESKRHLVGIYIDELGDFISSISADFGDALAQARGLGVGITGAIQFRNQLQPEVLAGVDANMRSKIVFNLSAADAKSMAAMAPELTPEDFMALPRYHTYSTFSQNGRNVGWVSGATLPMGNPICNAAALRKKVAARYGKPGHEIEKEYLDLLAESRPDIQPEIADLQIGRREKA